MALEKMADFFDARVEMYDSHMLADIAFAREFYPETAHVLPCNIKKLLDLGAGTGLELEEIFRLSPDVSVTAVDLAPLMLSELKRKFAKRDITVVCGDYLVLPFGNGIFDAAVSVESLHHFSENQKLGLYVKLFSALKPDGVFVLTDYFAADNDAERRFYNDYKNQLTVKDAADGEFHCDIPFTVAHEKRLLETAGFCVTVHKNYGNTAILICGKRG